jgi:predicted RND superfamily exporter protein
MLLWTISSGTMQYSGIHINVVTYVLIVMAIGLLVDFVMHILLRYYETTGTTRHAKVKETLKTMGASILLGGLTTFLGTVCLAFSSTTIFMVVFKAFLSMVSLGCGVGLILLPVVLSLIGPVHTTRRTTHHHHEQLQKNIRGEEDEENKKDHGGYRHHHQEVTKESDSFSTSDDEGERQRPSSLPASGSNEYDGIVGEKLKGEKDERKLDLIKSASDGGGYEAIVDV